MNIIEIGPGLIPIPPIRFGAIERVVWQLNLALTARGHDVTIINLPVITHEVRQSWPKDAVVHCHWAGHAATLQRLGVPYAFTSHSHMWRFTCWNAIIGSAMYLALHTGMVPDGWPGNKLEIVENGVDTDTWYNKGESRQKRIVACANYSKRKRLEWTFELIKKLPEPWTATVIGPNVPANLDDQYSERVSLIGELMPHEIAEIYNQSMIGFHPAQEEAYALVPMEMAACGLMTLVANESWVYPAMSSITPFKDVSHAASILLGWAQTYDSFSFSNAAAIHCSWDLVAERVERGLERMYEQVYPH